MKAGVVKGIRRISYEDVPTPSVQPGTLLLKTKYCSICGSDLEYVENKRAPQAPLKVGAILGHEFSAEVAAVGKGVKEWSVGDRAAYGPSQPPPCGQCYFCRHELYHLCTGGPAHVHGEEPGAMAEYFLRAPASVTKIPDSVSDEEAALCQPLSVGAKAVINSRLKIGDSVAVIGAGHVGLGAMLCARAGGAAPIIVADVVQSRLKKALEMGADVVLNPNETDVVSEAIKLTGVGVDIAFVTVSRGADVLKQAAAMVRQQGRVVIVGMPAPAELDRSYWIPKQIRVEGVRVKGAGMPNALRLLEYKRVSVKPLILVLPLKDVQRAFDSLYSGENIAVLLKP
jgi:threonine dehydrogenase-like Zn-dependent dehydrogenase